MNLFALQKKIAPEYSTEIRMLEKGSVQYLCNMFVMPKDLFFRYNQFCFSILSEMEKHVTTDKNDPVAARTLGYLGEFLLTVFTFKLQNEKKYIVKELNATYILSSERPRYLYFKYILNYILSKIIFGKKRVIYKQKRKTLKAILQSYLEIKCI